MEAIQQATGFLEHNLMLVIGGGAALVVLIALVWVMRARRRPIAHVAGGISHYTGAEDMTDDIVIAEVFAMLTVCEGPQLHPGQPFDLSEPTVRLGRAGDNDIVVPDETISRYHAEIRLEGDGFRVYDLGSDHGTFVNDQQVGSEGLAIYDRDELKLGTRTSLSFTTMQFDTAPLKSNTVTLLDAPDPGVVPLDDGV